MAPPLARRSGRLRRAARKYTDDAFQAVGLSPDNSGSEHLAAEELQNAHASDEDFVMGEDNEQAAAEEEDDFDDETGSVVGLTFDKTEQAERKLLAKLDRDMTHSRGLLKPAEHTAKNTQLKLTFGTGAEDLLPAIYARDRWAYGRDSTFPSAESFQGAQRTSPYGVGGLFCYPSFKMEFESTEAWDWYYDSSIGGCLLRNQQIRALEENVGREYFPKDGDKRHTVLVGPPGKQKEFHLGLHEFFDFGVVWEPPNPKAGKSGRSKNPDARSHGSLGDNAKDAHAMPEMERFREGWILNFGSKIQCAAWAPNCSGTTQYLAVVVPLPESQKAAECDINLTGAPAFTPSPPYPAAIQIWAFEAKQSEEVFPRPLDMSIEPRLRLVLCTRFGDVKRLCWCPMPRKPRSSHIEGKESINLGLLAGIWGDGSVKVLDVNIEKNSPTTQWAKVESPVFQAKPPSTLCTCLTWLSPGDLAVGCANGFIAVWSLPASCGKSESNPVPYIYTPIHTAYILNVVSAYPNHPYLLASSSIDGQMKLCSLVDPLVDIAEAIRTRMGTLNLSYSPFFQAFVTTDEADFVRLQPVRRFFSTISVLRSTSSVTAIAPCSPCHPTILVGSAGGLAMATNPLRRLLNPKNKHFQQTWFSHEWVLARDTKSEERLGVSRFYDGFKAESPNLLRSATQGKISSNMMTIYEEETGITVLAHNPNDHCGGWACAGLGCGLLRVEDLTLRPRR
ncbi:hypothetical protein CIHG_02774 [Coccidioides immitis H538.4]|uniref:Transcription factor tfiiic complex subunit tfc6 n=1 Tax=Coccidioides immitis H538.4 TaxID=396776 RepID=A0A0J8RK09_COCIT|nr:hypothetical protein CIHG_02774 [Coccidioides immitis H538.4]